ncbi:MAG: J domain-containing protein [Cyanophyceae cyanobacterium]
MTRTHYQTLGLTTNATSDQIKRAYRQLVKEHHPDVVPHLTQGGEERIRQINAAYEVLKNPSARQAYDGRVQRQQRPMTPTKPHNTVTDEATTVHLWMQQVYTPLNQALAKVLGSLRGQLRELSADPFDPDLMDDFVAYLEDCEQILQSAQTIFRRSPNPSSMAGVASYLYYTLNHLEDGLEEFRYFSLNFDDRHLHTGQELFRRARGIRTEAIDAMRSTYAR